MGKASTPASERVAVPSTPGVRPRVFRAARNPASTVTSVSTPVRFGIDATGVGVDEVVAVADDDVDVVDDEHAASENARAPVAATAKTAVVNLRMRVILFC